MNFEDLLQNKSDKELLEMVYDFHAWSPEMLTSVEQELTNRNILPTDLRSKKESLILEEDSILKQGKQAGLFSQVIGWLTVFGLLGIFIGYHHAFSQERSKYTSQTYFTYNEASRQQGKNLFYASVLLTTLALFYKLFVRSF